MAGPWRTVPLGMFASLYVDLIETLLSTFVPPIYMYIVSLCVSKDKPEAISPCTFGHPGILFYPEYFINKWIKPESFYLVKFRGWWESLSCTYLHCIELPSLEY